MNAVEQLVRKMRRLWVLEYSSRRALALLAVGANAALLGWLLHRTAGLPAGLVAAVAVVAVAAIVPVAILARLRSPSSAALAQMLDDRAEASDLFSSALAFHGRPERFGPLGALTCDLARRRAGEAALAAKWRLGSARQWLGAAAVAAVLLAAHVGVSVHGALTTPDDGRHTIAARPPVEPPPTNGGPSTTDPKPAEAPATRPAESPLEMIDDAPRPAETVKITDEMIDRYLKDAPVDMDVDLTGVTPIRWDAEEVDDKTNPQDRDDNEKIDPVKLDAALLKDLEQAKKTKDASGEKGGVDVAVMAKDTAGTKVKGKKGGKKGQGSLADATSKDPRGKPVRLAARPGRKGLQIRSAARAPSQQKGKDRPMGLLDFLLALRRAQARPAAGGAAGALAAARSEDRPVRQESVPEAAAEAARSYFDKLRKADP